jgi:hypothetical protein
MVGGWHILGSGFRDWRRNPNTQQGSSRWSSSDYRILGLAELIETKPYREAVGALCRCLPVSYPLHPPTLQPGFDRECRRAD